MGIFKKVGDFLLGKSPEIFNKEGRVLHQHPTKKWSKWKERYLSGADYNWKNHTGMRARGEKSKD